MNTIDQRRIRDFGDSHTWLKASKSVEQGGNCVFTAVDGDSVGVRDSKQGPGGPVLWLDPSDWASLAKTISR